MDCIAIKDVRSGMKNINVVFIILENISCSKTKENREVNSFKVADPTASINCSIWDEPGKLLLPGDIVKLTKGYASLFRGCLTLYSGKSGEILKMGDFCMVFNEQINLSEPIQQNASQAIQGNHITANSNSNSNGGSNNGNRPSVVVNPPIVSSVDSKNPSPIVTTSSSSSNQSNKQTKSTPPSKAYVRKPISKK